MANETFTFNYPPGLSDIDMASSFADFIENEVEFLHVSSIDENVVIINSSYLSEDLDNFTSNINPDSKMATEFKWIPEWIPTLTQWGVHPVIVSSCNWYGVHLSTANLTGDSRSCRGFKC